MRCSCSKAILMTAEVTIPKVLIGNIHLKMDDF